MTNQYIEQIPAFLDGTLTGQALEAFEQALQTDPELATEVQLYRDMAAALKPAPAEDALRANLKRLGRENTPVTPVRRRIWLAAACLLALLGIALLWRSRVPAPETTPARPPVQETPKTAPPVAQKTTPVPPTPARTNGNAAEKVVKPRLYAAAYAPNPRLEAMLGSRLRGDDYLFRITQPTANTSLKRRNGTANFILSGTLETSSDEVQAPFRVLIFSNNPADYESFSFVFSASLVFEKEQDAFRFRTENPLQAPPGLYYFLIEDENSGLPYFTGKFRVSP